VAKGWFELTTSGHAESFARRTLLRFEGALNKIFGNDLNPFYHLGALGFYFFWVVVISGFYIYAFYDTGVRFLCRFHLHGVCPDGLWLVV